MLTTQNRDARLSAGLLTVCAAFWFIGCTPPGPKALLDGERLLRDGQEQRAIQRLERAQRLLPQDPRAWTYLGLAYHQAGRLDDAAHAYQNALALDPSLATTRFNLGCLALEQGDILSAIDHLTHALVAMPALESAWIQLGTAQLRAGQIQNADRSFRQALQINGRLPEAWNGLGLVQVQRGRYPDALQSFQAAIDIDPDYAPAVLNTAVLAQQHLNNPQLALEKYQAALSLHSPHVRPDLIHAIARELEENLHASAELERKPEPATPPIAKARPEPVESATKPAPKPAPRPAPAVKPTTPPSAPAASPTRTTDPIAGPTPAETPRPAQVAGVDMPPVVESGTDDAPTTQQRYPYRGVGLLTEGDRASAERLVSEGVRFYDRNRFEEAIDLYARAVEVDPTYFDAHYNLGVAAFEQGDLSKAIASYQKALALEPSSLKAGFNLALALERAGYPRDAANEFEKLLARHPAEVRIHLRLGNLYAGPLRDRVRARNHYLRVLELDPRHPQGSAIRFWLEVN
jgi:protein O-GlcNAc transferase